MQSGTFKNLEIKRQRIIPKQFGNRINNSIHDLIFTFLVKRWADFAM